MTLDEFLQLRYRTVLSPIAPEDGGGWLVEAPDLPGCTSDGESPEETLANFDDARREWFQAMTEEGRTIPLPQAEEVRFSGKFTLRLPRSLHREIAQAAQREGVSQNQYVLSLLSYGFGVKGSSGRRFTFEQLVRIDGIGPNPDALTRLDQIPVVNWRAINARTEGKAES